MRQTLKMVEDNQNSFYFTTLENIRGNNVIADPIWQQAKIQELQQLPLEYGGTNKSENK